ncbi:MAG: GGDEF domain-containing protein, partial [Pseudomonadota bacterium]
MPTARSAAEPAPATPQAEQRRAVPLVGVVVAVGAVGLLLAAGCGYALGLWLRVDVPWAAALSAALGMAVATVPLGALMLWLARGTEAAPAVAAAPGVAAPAGAAPAGAAMSREEFVALAARVWARSRRYGSGAAMLVVELDHWRRLVDQRGGGFADAVLQQVVHDTAPTLRGADALALFAEGQLAVFLAHADATGALDVAERIRERTELLDTSADGRRLRSTVSGGVAHLRPAHLHLQALIDDALEAVVAARTAGGNCVRAAPGERSRRDGRG